MITSARVDTSNRCITRRRFVSAFTVLTLVSWSCVRQTHRRYVALESGSPLDHVATAAVKPLYGLTCPKVPSLEGGRCSAESDGRPIRGGGVGIRNETIDATNDDDGNGNLPRMFMISARPSASAVLRTWTDGGFNVTLLPTFNLSVSYSNDEGRCQSLKFHQRLTYVYSTIFRRLLKKYPSDRGFILLEDDAALVDANGFREEACHASSAAGRRRGKGRIGGFYSFFRTEKPSSSVRRGKGQKRQQRRTPSCMYSYGMVAFYVRRDVMERISRVVDTDSKTFCRLPIDMILATWGPWYVSAREVVRHTGDGKSTRNMGPFSGGGRRERRRRRTRAMQRTSSIDRH